MKQEKQHVLCGMVQYENAGLLLKMQGETYY